MPTPIPILAPVDGLEEGPDVDGGAGGVEMTMVVGTVFNEARPVVVGLIVVPGVVMGRDVMKAVRARPACPTMEQAALMYEKMTVSESTSDQQRLHA